MNAEHRSLFRAITRPLSALLLWQSTGWIAFGILEPSIAQGTGDTSSHPLIFIVAVVMTALTASLGFVALFHWRTRSQGEFLAKARTHYKCPYCGHSISPGASPCPHCGSRILY